jgi:hypothetical protein
MFFCFNQILDDGGLEPANIAPLVQLGELCYVQMG